MSGRERQAHERLVTLLASPRGRSIRELADGVGWRPASVRGALSRMRAHGVEVERLHARPPRYRLKRAAAGGSSTRDESFSFEDSFAAKLIGLL